MISWTYYLDNVNRPKSLPSTRFECILGEATRPKYFREKLKDTVIVSENTDQTSNYPRVNIHVLIILRSNCIIFWSRLDQTKDRLSIHIAMKQKG